MDVKHAARILDEDHYDFEKVKDRILDYLAVLQAPAGAQRPHSMLRGPARSGQNVLGKSIARALDRKFARISMGGMHDEAEIRGHRRTYIGALPGQIIHALRRAGANDPVFMLDEVDKLGRDFRGDPASALLRGPDPEQNSTFRDNYLDVPFDLSKVLFITTANVLDRFPTPSATAWKSSTWKATPKRKRRSSPTATWCPADPRERAEPETDVHFSDEAVRNGAAASPPVSWTSEGLRC